MNSISSKPKYVTIELPEHHMRMLRELALEWGMSTNDAIIKIAADYAREILRDGEGVQGL